MYKSILVAYNGTQESRAALLECIRLAPPHSTHVQLLAVAESLSARQIGEYGVSATYGVTDMPSAENMKMQKELDEGLSILQNADLNVTACMAAGEPVEIISTMAEEVAADLIIVGHPRHRPWMLRWWRGSTDASLLERVHCTLMIAPGLPEPESASHRFSPMD